jgi:hypothetical protein
MVDVRKNNSYTKSAFYCRNIAVISPVLLQMEEFYG